MTYLISILSQFETRYKMVLILTLARILLVLGSPVKLHADQHNKAQVQYMTGLKLLKDQSQNAASNHAKANIWFTMAAYEGHEGALFHLGFSYYMTVACKRIYGWQRIFTVWPPHGIMSPRNII